MKRIGTRIGAAIVWMVAILLLISACTGGDDTTTKETKDNDTVQVEANEPVAEPVEDDTNALQAFDVAIREQVTEYGNGLDIIGELFMLLADNPLAGQTEEFEYTAGEVTAMLGRLLDNAKSLDAPEGREEVKQTYIEIIERTQGAVDVAFEGVRNLDSEQINEGGIMMDEVNQMIETFVDGLN